MAKQALTPKEQFDVILKVRDRNIKRAIIATYISIPLIGYVILGGFFLSNHLAIFWPTAALALVGIVVLLVWARLWRFAVSEYLSQLVMIVVLAVIVGGGWTALAFIAAGPHSDGETYLGQHMGVLIALLIAVLLVALVVAMIAYMKLNRSMDNRWADKRYRDNLRKQIDEEAAKK